MNITVDLLREKNACSGGIEWFERAFPRGAEYQELLGALATEDNVSWALWALKNFGSLDTVFEADEINTNHSFFFAGTIKVKFGIKVKGSLVAGKEIWAGAGVVAGKEITAGGGIEAGFGITAGAWIVAGAGIVAGKEITAGRGIEAGAGVVAGKEITAGFGITAGAGIWAGAECLIKSNEKPDNIKSGTWKKC